MSHFDEDNKNLGSENKTVQMQSEQMDPGVSTSNQNQPGPTKEESMIWDYEIWKRAEETRFKAYLKQLEYKYMYDLQEKFKGIEEENEKVFQSKIKEINLLHNRTKKKASELESRENKITLCEEELKLKINEVSRQLLNKDEEIAIIKKRFKEEKFNLDKEKTAWTKALAEKDKKYALLEEAFKKYKQEIEDSPWSVLKNEINKKQIQYEELQKEKLRIQTELDKANKVNDKVKGDLIKMKKAYDAEKEMMYKQRVDEVEKIKFEIYNQKMSNNEMDELKLLRNKVQALTENGNVNAATGTAMNGSNTMNYNYTGMTQNQQQQMTMTGNIHQQGNETIKKEYKIWTYNRRAKANERNVRTEIERLTKERDMLLSGGMYEPNDPLICQWDIKINKMLENSGNY